MYLVNIMLNYKVDCMKKILGSILVLLGIRLLLLKRDSFNKIALTK